MLSCYLPQLSNNSKSQFHNIATTEKNPLKQPQPHFKLILLCFLSGIGTGFQYVPALLVPQLCFEKKRALAIAIAVSGCPLGSFLYSPIMQMFINTFGWRGAVLITGAVFLNGCAFAIVLVPPNLVPEKKYEPVRPKMNDMGSIVLHSVQKLNDPTIISADMKMYETFLIKLKTIFDVSVLKSGSILCVVFLQWTLFCLGFPIFANFLPLVTYNYGITKDTASFMLSVLGVSDVVGRLLFGILGSLNKIDSVLLWCATTIGCGILQFCMTWANTTYIIYPLTVLYGLCMGKFILLAYLSIFDFKPWFWDCGHMQFK